MEDIFTIPFPTLERKKQPAGADNAGKNPGPNIGGHIIAFPENSQRSAVRPILSLNIADCSRGKVQADQRDAHAAYNRREQVVDQTFSKNFNNKGEHQKKAPATMIRHGGGNLLILSSAEAGIADHTAQGGDKGKGAAQESGHPAAGAKVKNQGPNACTEQSDAHIKTSVKWDQNGGAAHGKRVLESQRQ